MITVGWFQKEIGRGKIEERLLNKTITNIFPKLKWKLIPKFKKFKGVKLE